MSAFGKDCHRCGAQSLSMTLTAVKYISPINVGVFIIWLFHISAIIGISIGYETWFVEKTPLNLLLIFTILILLYPAFDGKRLILFALCFLTGMTVEWLGVKYGFLFGNYSYGTNLGPKLDGVPWLIGVNWGVLTFITASISTRFSSNIWIRAIVGASLMVIMDIPMEGVAPRFDFWRFAEHPVPLSNYLGWFITALFLHIIMQWRSLQGSRYISTHIFFAQLLFFSYFYVFFSL